MTRYSLSNEADILNRMDQMSDSLYRGLINRDDVAYSIRTVKNLLLEIYLIRQQLSSDEANVVDKEFEKAMIASENLQASLSAFEANKPI